MVPAAITQQMSGEPGVLIPLVLLVLLLTVAWRRDPATTRALYRSITAGSHPVIREGIIAGIIGATCVAVWFFFIDLFAAAVLSSRPLRSGGHSSQWSIRASWRGADSIRRQLHRISLRRVRVRRHCRRRDRRMGE